MNQLDQEIIDKNRWLTIYNSVRIQYVLLIFSISTIIFNFVLNLWIHSHVTKTENKDDNKPIKNLPFDIKVIITVE